ncbi:MULTISPECIES: OmpA family protein [Pseudomonas]|uniref:OmpA family protein n=1 Tax=Pseudomonas TaxID=286 RepID=UPI0013E02D7C|nr:MULTISPECIES: OmpA family protein [Pseudomonas]MCE0909836.1 OmpA family protein [Pseudomonas kurunegalensis]WJR56403.1 OmpA family protein [Pseudomonas kurunegalensis]
MLSTKTMQRTALATAIAVGLSGCATIDKTLGERSGKFACGAGAVLGSLVVGGVVAAAGGNGNQIAAGAVAGGALGCAALYAYKQRVDRLKAVAAEQGLTAEVREVEMVDASGQKKSVGVEAQIEVAEMFSSGSATLTAEGYRKLSMMAQEFARDRAATRPGVPAKKLLVVGHTDSSGGAELNQRLSEKRAQTVADMMAAIGVPKQDIFFQGAGSARPVADNTTDAGRAKNRRVEIVEVDNEQVLAQRVRDERSSAKYLAHGTAVESKVKAKTVAAKPSTPSKPIQVATAAKQPVSTSAKLEAPVINKKAPVLPTTPAQDVVVQLGGKGGIDFGGVPVTTTTSMLSSRIQPKSSTFSMISSAYADAPVTSCVGDLPRVEGEVKNLATGKALKDYSTTDFLPGLNGGVWASKVNGHVAAVGPVAVLRDTGAAAGVPIMQFTSNVGTANRKDSAPFKSVANTYEGETQVLYRVFALDQKSTPVSCMDIVFDKRAGNAVAGEIYYPKQGDAYVAQFQPKKRG